MQALYQETLYQENSYLQNCTAIIEHICLYDAKTALALSPMLFYPEGGGQPGDQGTLQDQAGHEFNIINTIYIEGVPYILLETEQPNLTIGLTIGQSVNCILNWERRHRHMRMHTALHLLCALIPCKVNGCQVGHEKSRIDFHIGDFPLDKAKLEQDINHLIAKNHTTQAYFMEEATLDANPELVRTMSVAPPRHQGAVRVLNIGGEGAAQIDLQPCGGTHVQAIGEIGKLRIGKIESKGGGNKRIYIHFQDT